MKETAMNKIRDNSLRLLLDEEGVISIEYALMAVCIALVAAIGINSLGTALNKLFADVAALLSS
jgi:Flp pilus assembly pilin Flp